MYPDNYPDYNKLPDVPTCMREATHATQELHGQVRTIKKLMEAEGLAPAHWDEEWHVPFTDGDLFTTITRLIIDIQLIKDLLVYHGYANEKIMIPLTPRWRIDGHKAHYRNAEIFEQCVRRIIQQEKDGLPEGSFVNIVDGLLGQDKDGRAVK